MRAWRAALPGAALLCWIAIVATLAHGDVKKHDDAVDWWPGRGRMGPESCLHADDRQGGHADGTYAYFADAQQTCPMQCGGTGAWCVHEAGVWDCCKGASQICTGCDPNPCLNGGICVPNCNGPPICICPCGFSGDQCETPGSTTTTTLPMPNCDNPGAPCGTCTGPTGVCLPRCDGGFCQLVCVQLVNGPCPAFSTTDNDCLLIGGGAVCVGEMPADCVGGVCDAGTVCGFPCFGSPTTTLPTTTTTTTTIITTTTTTVTTTTTTDTTPTTTTTTVTTTTSTTTLPIIASSTFLPVPDYSMSEQDRANPGVVGQMFCGRFIATNTLHNITSMAGIHDHNAVFTGSEFAIYPDDDSGTILAAVGGCTTVISGNRCYATTHVISWTTFDVDIGTIYRACYCSTDNAAGTYLAVGWPANGFPLEQSAFVPSVGIAANTCFSPGTVPTTTGAITMNGTVRVPYILLSAEP